jgi:FkbM family methyltransferase
MREKIHDLNRKMRMLVTSRVLFNNWLSAGIKYYLITFFPRKAITVRCNNQKYVLSAGAYASIVTAYYDYLFEKLLCEEVIIIQIGLNYCIKLINNDLEFIYEGRKIYLYDSADFLRDIIFENFIGGAYNDIVVDNKTVVDIGAGVGDTSILFALKGAKRVIALEPFFNLFKKAMINVKINNLENKILLLNAALGSSDDVVCTEFGDVLKYRVFKPNNRCNKKVTVYTLNTLVNKFNIEEGSILKMDCEGCEYETILNMQPSDLAKFSQIIIEYHNGYIELKKILELAGFETKLKPIRSIKVPIEKQGYIVAKRKI